MQAAAVLEVCRSRGVPLLINDRVDVALAVGADGVHIGQVGWVGGWYMCAAMVVVRYKHGFMPHAARLSGEACLWHPARWARLLRTPASQSMAVHHTAAPPHPPAGRPACRCCAAHDRP